MINSKASLSMLAYIYASMMGGSNSADEGIKTVGNPFSGVGAGASGSSSGVFHSGMITRGRKLNNRGKIIRRRRSMKIR